MKSAQEELKISREHLISRFQNGNARGNFQEDYSEVIDHYFRSNIQESDTGRDLFKKEVPFSLVAVGGYGRKELCLYSDIGKYRRRQKT
jgi:[protein-PII] uridylyltransferase